MAAEPAPSAAQSDPLRLGWMTGSPPPPDKVVRLADGSAWRFPQLRWSFSNYRQLMPTTNVSRGLGPCEPLARAERPELDAVSFTPLGAEAPMRWAQAFEATYTDGIVVLHRGRIVHERYAGALRPEGQHIAMSVTKSFFGLLGAVLVAEGRLDEHARVAHYVPQLRGT